MKKENVFYYLFGIAIIILFIIGNEIINKNKELNSNNILESKEISMMLETSDNSGEYERKNNITYKEVIESGYHFNNELSKCDNGSKLSWDFTNSAVIYEGNTSDNCYIYFDKNYELASYIINEVYTEDGVNGLYYHDGEGTYMNSNLEAGDKSYRYSGTDPDNYLCFNEGCTDDEKYRIIGVIDNKVKVIKMTSVGTKAWNSTIVNTWAGSTMEKYLNGEYLTKLGENTNLIDTTTWHVGGYTWNNQAQTKNAKEVHSLELNSKPTINRKIGLIYTSDYMYAAEPIYWSLVGYNGSDATKDYRASNGKDWLLSTSNQWTISRYSDMSDGAFRISSAGIIGSSGGVNAKYSVFPSFSLLSSVKYVSGSGTIADPYIVG